MGESYVATPVAGKTLVNGQRLSSRRGLEHGDVLRISGLELEFRLSA
jgi:pSer/pThr/pTyr-binding forkhead associated (FHA) protein